MLLKEPEHEAHIVHGNSFSGDGHADPRFDYLLANPPFGVEWKKIKAEVEDEHQRLGFAGRFGAGLPRINDGSFLFLQHMISKMKPVEEGRISGRHRLQRLTALYRGRRIGGIGDTALDPRERLAGSRRRPPRPTLLQHRHLHLLLDRHQPQEPRTSGQGSASGRPRLLGEDAQVPRREAQAHQRRRNSQHRPTIRRLARRTTA